MENSNFKFDEIIFKDHAFIRMFERGFSRDDILEVIELGEVIEDYPNDYPYPSKLIFKIVKNRPVHVVLAIEDTGKRGIVITLYEPDIEHFEQDLKKRKKS